MGELQIEAAREEHKYYPYTGIFFANRHTFWNAGQDSWTLPPAQNPDMFLQLNNVEPVLQGVLQRRRGYTLFTNAFTGNSQAYSHSYSFRSDNLNLRSTVWTSANRVDVADEQGNTVVSPLFSTTAGAVAPRMVLSRDYGYFADGIAADYKKWDGTTTSGNLSKWGIDVTDATGGGANTTLAPTLAANDSSGVSAWSNPTFALVQDNADASLTMTSQQVGDNLLLTGFGTGAGFSIPASATILQIRVSGTGFVTSAGGFFPTIKFTLLNNGVPIGGTNGLVATIGIPKDINGAFTTTFSPANAWGHTWTPAEVNSAGFGVAVSGVPFSIIDTSTFNIDSLQITVVYSGGTGSGNAGSITVGNPGTGNVTLLNGRTYFYAFQNSKTGHVSGLSAPSLSTGPLSSKNVPLSTIAVSNDPQVDTVLILATADGNDQTTLYLLASLPNGTTTYTDNTPDTNAPGLFAPFLVNSSVYLNTDLSGNIHGIANNDAPTHGAFPVKHKGRLYMAHLHHIHFSKNLDEVTTADGLITSRWEESWPATNQFDISETAETVRALLSDGETLWIGTERSIRRVIGDSPSNFQKPEIQFNEVGVLNQDVWKVVFMEGQPVGTMWLTPDFRVIGSDFNTYLDVGTPIQDVLNTVTPAAAQNVHAMYVNNGPADYYMLYLPTRGSFLPNTVCVFNLRSKKWFIWTPTDNISTSLFLIDGNGAPRWLFASAFLTALSTASGALYEWTAGTFQDRIGLGGVAVSYPATIQTTWLDLGDYTLRKFVNQIIPTTADQTGLTIQVEAASNELDFNTPLLVVPPTLVTPAAIPTDVFVPLASGPSHSRAFRFTFVSPPSTIGNILTGFSIEAGSFHKY